MTKPFDAESRMKGNKSRFEEHKKKATAPPADNKQNAAEVEAKSKSKTWAKGIFRNASVSANTDLATPDVASEDALEAAADKSTSRSLFFEKLCWRSHAGGKTGGVARASSRTPYLRRRKQRWWI
jgi:hypothetical protein